MTESPYYPFPAEHYRIDAFDTTVDDTRRVVLGGSQMSYAYRASAETDPTHAVDFDMDALCSGVPMGYKILRFAQKVAVAEDASIVQQWPLIESADRFLDAHKTPHERA
jgi:hypothetical protein